MTLTPEDPTRWLIVGLGNPEKKYTANRHNVGFHVLDRLAAKTGVSITDRRFQGWFGKAAVGQHAMLLLKPTTFMNASGAAIAKAANYYKIPSENVAVVYDDIDSGVRPAAHPRRWQPRRTSRSGIGYRSARYPHISAPAHRRGSSAGRHGPN